MDENLNTMEMVENETAMDLDVTTTDIEVQHSEGDSGITTGQLAVAGVGLMIGTTVLNCVVFDAYQFGKKHIARGAKFVKNVVTEKVDKVKTNHEEKKARKVKKQELDKEIENKTEN